MPEPDDELRAAFADLQQRTLPHARLAETPALHTVARGRIRRLMAATAAGVALAVLVPAVMAAVVLRQSAPPPAYPPATSPVVEPTPTMGPTQPPGQSMRILGPPRLPTEVDDARLELPDWSQPYCASGHTQFQAGQWVGEPVAQTFVPTVTVKSAATGDVNGDGAADLLVYLSCAAGTDPGGNADQVVAYARRGSGTFDLIGQVARVRGGQEYLRAAEIEPDGTVRVLHVSAPDVYPPVAEQWRRFRWTGRAFRSEGATAVELELGGTRYVVSVNATALTPDAASGRSATLTVTVANSGLRASTSVLLSITAEGPVTSIFDRSGTPLVRNDRPGDRYWGVLLEPLAPGESVTGAFTIQVSGDDVANLAQSTPMSVWVDGREVAGYEQEAEEGYQHLRAASFGLTSS